MALWRKKPPPPPKPSGSGASIYLGRYLDLAKGAPGTDLTYDGERHLLLFGPNGSGKGTRLLVNNLLRLRDRSIIVIDPKGELTAITADYRRKLGEVVVLNPFDVLELGGAGFNPLAALDPEAPTFVDDATGIGEALIKVEDKDPHWSESAQSLLVALLMWEVQSAKREARAPLLENVRRMLTEPNEYERDAGGKSKLVKGLRVTAARMAAQGGFEVESLVGRFLRDNDEIASIQSTADRQTGWMLSPLMRANMAKNDIDFGDLKERPITVYLILPAERMRTHSVWLRLVIVSALRALYRPGGLKTLFMLDEFAQLGHLAPMEDAFGLVRGFGVQLWPVLQDLNQLKALYKERWETFVGNAGVVQGFAPNDLTTAKWMSERTGDTTVTAAGYNTGDSLSNAGQGSMSTGLSYGQVRRALFLPQELMDFPTGSGLLWPAGTSKSVPFYAPSYWDMPDLKSRARSNPYFAATGTFARRPSKAAARPAAKTAPAPKAQSETARAIRSAQRAAMKAVPPAMQAIKKGTITGLEFLGWAGLMAFKHTPPLVRKLKASAIETAGRAHKATSDAIVAYQRSREQRSQPASKIEPGPPVAASRDAQCAEQTAPSKEA